MKLFVSGFLPNVFVQALQFANIAYTQENDNTHTHIYCNRDSDYVSNEPWVSLTNKELAPSLLANAGLPTLPKIKLQSKEQLLNCGFSKVLLKPAVNTGGQYKDEVVNNTVFYKIFSSPQRLAEILDIVGSDFWDSLSAKEYIVQQAAVNDDGTTTHLHLVGMVNGLGECIWHSPSKSQKIGAKVGNIQPYSFAPNGLIDEYNVSQQAEKIVSHYNIANKFMKFQFVIADGKAYCTDISFTYSQWRYNNFIPIDVFADHIKFVYDMQPSITKPDTNCYMYKQYNTVVNSNTHREVAERFGIKYIMTPQPYPLYGASGNSEEQLLEKFNSFELEIRYA